MKRLSRRQFLKSSAAGALLALPFSVLLQRRWDEPHLKADTEHPNIVLLTLDALRADHLSCYGYHKPTSPNIDRLAADGVQFTQAVSTAPWTFPSFSAIHTSMYPTELDISVHEVMMSQLYSKRLDPLRITLAEKLSAQGYQTQAIVTNPWLYPERGFGKGFNRYTFVDRQQVYDYDLLVANTLAGRLTRHIKPAEATLRGLYETFMGPAGQDPWQFGVPADRVTDTALERLDRYHGERFFFWIHYLDPHYPYAPPATYRPHVPNVSDERLTYLMSLDEFDMYSDEARLRPADQEAILGLYDGDIRNADQHLGRFLDSLDSLGLRENTLVVLTADHGEEFWDHGRWQHGQSLYNELVHVPLIVRGPGLAPRKIDEVVRHIDIAPTLTEAAGTSFHPDAHGISLWPLLKQTDSSPRAAFSEGLFRGMEKKAIRKEDLKLIYDPISGASELYNLRSDPRELDNLAEQYPATVNALKQELAQWQLAIQAKYDALPHSPGNLTDQAPIDTLRSGGY